MSVNTMCGKTGEAILTSDKIYLESRSISRRDKVGWVITMKE